VYQAAEPTVTQAAPGWCCCFFGRIGCLDEVLAAFQTHGNGTWIQKVAVDVDGCSLYISISWIKRIKKECRTHAKPRKTSVEPQESNDMSA